MSRKVTGAILGCGLVLGSIAILAFVVAWQPATLPPFGKSLKGRTGARAANHRKDTAVKWSVEIYDAEGALTGHKETDFVGTKAAVAAMKERKKGETARFIAPIGTPRLKIDELVAMGAIRTFP